MSLDLDYDSIAAEYKKLVDGDTTARQGLYFCAVPLVQICVNQILRTNSDAQKYRDELDLQGFKILVELVDKLAGMAKPVGNAKAWLSSALKRQLVNHLISLRAPCGIGPKSRTVRAGWAERGAKLASLLESSTVIGSPSGTRRRCNFCDPPHITSDWYPITRIDQKKSRLKILGYVCKDEWERSYRSKRSRSTFPFLSAMYSPKYKQRSVLTLIEDWDAPAGQLREADPVKQLRTEVFSACKNDEQRVIIQMRLQGIDTGEIARIFGCSQRSVQLGIKDVKDRIGDQVLAV